MRMMPLLSQQAERRLPTDLTGKVTKLSNDTYGYGGFSDVYKGILNETGGRVAIKVLRGLHTNPEALKEANLRLDREARVWRALNHKNVLKFLGVCQGLDPSPALISPLCDAGRALEYVLKHPEVDRSLMIFGIAEGLAYLHKNDVVHGDLKNNNILIDDRGNPLLCDFGRSKILGHAGFTTVLGGTYRYLAPELFGAESNQVLTKESDVYSFGLVGLELVTGRPPFDEVLNDIGLFLKISQGEHPATGLVAPPGYEGTWLVLEGCWRQDPQSRVTIDGAVRRLQ